DDTVTNDIDQNPALTVAKAGLVDQSTLDANGNAVANQTKINYSVTATNTGDVTLTGVTISDPKVSTWTSCTPAAPATLAAGAKITCTGTYTLTQTDIDYGSVANTATSTGNPPGCDPSVDPSCQVTGDDTVTNDVTQSPALSVVKTGVLSGGATDGATIAYTVTATNTGDVTLHDVVVTDALVPALTCDKSTLVPGETTTCTGTYTVKQTDVDAGQVVNTATADGIDPQGHHVDGQDDVTTDLTPAPSIDVVKTGTLAGDAKAGQAVNYQVVATNTGNVTLHNVTVTDPLVTNLVCGGNGTLLPGASVTCQGSYVLKQSDVNNGQVVNTATADGTDPKGNHVNGHDSATVDLPPAPSISLAKSASPNDSLSFQVGQLVTYSFVATNTGNVTLHGVTVTDPLPGLSPVACPTSATAWISGQVGVLNPGDQIVCTATYTLTQADINAGKVANTATTTGTSPTGTDVTGQDSLTLPETQSATLTLVKTAATIVGADASLTGVNPGATIYYTLTGKNTGNVTLTDVVITDDMGLDNWVCDHSSTDAILPGATITCTGSHVVPSTGVTGVVNNANITGKPLDPAGPTPKPADATVTVPVHQPPTATPETALITVSTDTGSTTTVAVLDGLPQPGSAPIIYPLTAIGSITAVAGDASAVTATIDPVTGKITVTSTESGVYLIPVTYVDGNGVTVTITHRVTVIAPDVATTSANQNKTLPGKPVSMSVLSRGGDHGAGLTVVSTTQPSNGVVTMNPDGSLTYTPNPGYSGPDSFTYTAQDSDGNQAVATVQLTVIPVANPDSGTTKVDTPLVIPGTQLLNNDSGTKLTITSVPKAGQTGYPTHGTVSYDPATGNATYTPNPGYSGPDSFTYVTTDQYGQLTTTVVNIMVTPTANPDQITVPQNSTNNVITVAGNDRGTGLVPTSVPARGTPGGPTHGTVQIVNGQVLYTPDQGFTGQDTFTYTVIDASGQPATSTVTLTVTAAPIPTYTVQTGGNLAPVSPLSGLLILLAAAGVTIIGFHSRFRRVCISRKGN
ncbi:MAG: cadherin-like domain-containing protein, partial [Propionibacteriaceae bacterium]|nr:cadherin-like domain-containing protein [Propionibacteriaceae bacterium]